MIKVTNKYKDPRPGIYIGRGSPFGNPFPIKKDGDDRNTVCDKYEVYFHQEMKRSGSPLKAAVEHLIAEASQGKEILLKCFCKPLRCHGDTIKKYVEEHMIEPVRVQKYGWDRKVGYQCSSKGDKRFSAYFARMPDGRTIEMHYQCDVKGYLPGGTNTTLGKGKPPLDPSKDLYAEYLQLWKIWAANNPDLISELKEKADQHGRVLADFFATTPVNQARALAEILDTWEIPKKTESTKVRCVIAGSRDFNDYALLEKEMVKYLNQVAETTEQITIISGNARGADLLGERFAQEYGLKLERYPAEWDRYGKRAGYLRNEHMANIVNHAVIFWDGISKGTKHMIDICDKKNIPGVVFNYGDQPPWE
ncbi:DUF4326 domain-containing protein [Marinobacterium litorale]|uniref:DUF4326 domain-containing protein n=1 Tax=Marinobacterium litorale TaxID=404770 RepID=UPI0004164846|nr:SLOG family protein [Marinobacterium litorale]